MKTKIFLYSAIILLLQFPCNIFAEDNDGDGIDDYLEEQIAYKFAPVLHRHSWDLQEGLQNFDLIVQNPSLSEVKIWTETGQEIKLFLNVDPNSRIHKWRWDRFDTFGKGYYQTMRFYEFHLNNSIRHSAATSGNRPIYYHIYRENCHFYLQYWYYFTMNDLREHNQTLKNTYHESDWEHVTLQLHKNTNIDYVFPRQIDFYRHEGGKTYVPEDCWWSTSVHDTTYESSKLRQGYDENHTHLHIWLAANSHSSYNRGAKVYKLEAILKRGEVENVQERFIDNVDYEPQGSDLYFTFDSLENLGEVEISQNAHGYTWDYHMTPNGTLSKGWLGYQYIMGDDFWSSSTQIRGAHIFSIPITWRKLPGQFFNFLYSNLPSFASLPPFGLTSPVQPWLTWEEDYTENGFGNKSVSKNYWIVEGGALISFVDDPKDGD